jgi:hypothetical protein
MLRLGEIISAMAIQRAVGAPDRGACFGCIVPPDHTSYDGPDSPAVPTEASSPKLGEPVIGYRIEIDPVTGERLYHPRDEDAGSK